MRPFMSLRRSAVGVVCLVLLWGLVPACTCLGGGENVAPAEPHISVPERVVADPTALGLSTQVSALIRNPGTDVLRIDSVRVEGPQASAFRVSLGGTEALPNGSTTFTVTFSPDAEGPLSAVAVLRTNALEGEETRVALEGTGLPGALEVTPLTVDFGTVGLGMQRTQVLTLRNNTNQELSVRAQVVEDPGNGFELYAAGSSEVASITVPPSGSTTTTVAFAPVLGGRNTGVVLLSYCGERCGVRVPMVGLLSAPLLDVSPVVLDLGRTLRDQPVDGVVTVSNRGGAPLSLSAAQLTGTTAFSLVDPPTFPHRIDADAALDLRVRFDAASPGRSEGALELTSDDPRTPNASVVVTATTGGSDVTAVPGVVQFGAVLTDDAQPADVALINRGDEPATITALELLEDLDFYLDAPPPLPHTLPPGGALLLTVFFGSSQLEVHRGTLRVHSTSTGHPTLDVPLEATRADRACRMVALTPEVSFGAIRVGQQSQALATVTNQGTGPCALFSARSSAVFGANPAFVFTSAPGPLAPGGTAQVAVRFSPRAVGMVRSVAELPVQGLPPVRITARGVGTDASMSVNPAFLDFGRVAASCSNARRTVTVLSDGASTVTVLPPAALGGAPFAVEAPGFPANLGPGLARTFAVTFTPQAAGVFLDTVVLSSADTPPISLTVALRGEGIPSTVPVEERFTVTGRAAVDVLMVVDDSGSMEDNQARLSENIQRFMDVAEFRSVDYHLGVVTTDVESPLAGKLRGTPPVLTRSSAGQLATRVQVGTNGSGFEQGLHAAMLAVSPPLVFGANNGFLRDEAALAIVVVSDENDSSPLEVSQYVDVLTGLKAVTNAPVIISAITGGAMGCQDPSGDQSATPAPRYQQAVAATGGVDASICDPDWGTKLRTVGEAALLAGGRFVLRGQPIPETVAVSVNGAPRTSGWRYDSTGNAVVFEGAGAPAVGSTVTVTYQTRC